MLSRIEEFSEFMREIVILKDVKHSRSFCHHNCNLLKILYAVEKKKFRQSKSEPP